MKMVQTELDEEEVAEKHDRYIYKRKCSLTRVRFMICESKDKELSFTDCTKEFCLPLLKNWAKKCIWL